MLEYAAIYENELLNHVLPFWLGHSLDREHGGYFTCLDTAGACYDTRKYMWLQGRQVWMLARLYNSFDRRPEWLDACHLGARFLRAWGKNEQGRVYFSVTREGKPVALQRKIFSECFYVMAMAEYYKATGDESARDEALAMFATVEDLIAHPDQLGRPALAGQRPASTLAVPMIVLGLLEELLGVMDPAAVEAKSRACAAAMRKHYDADLHLLRENIAIEGSLNDLPEGRLINPGHSIEGAWFLLHYARRYGDAEALAQALTILEGSLEFGWDQRHGGIFYFMDAEGKPLPQLESSMKLWWPHTEALYALVAAWCQTGQDQYAVWHRRIHDYCFEHFVDHRQGEWFGYCDRQGVVTQQSKGGPYKGCFHVPRALLFSILALRGNAK